MVNENRLDEIFHECSGRDPSEWDNLVAELPEGQRTQLLAMLQCDQELNSAEDSFLEPQVSASGEEITIDLTQPLESTFVGENETRECEHPERIGDYRILNLLAIHGQGAVYRADHPHLNRQVVIKVSKNQLDKENQRAVLDEGRALATLSHPNLAQVFDLQFQDGCPYLVMEYIEGRNLAEQVKDTTLPPDEAANLIATMADAIQHAHEVGIIHQDLKPANVVIRAADKTPKIIDFGLATTRTAYEEDSLNTTYGGTIAYMAPEQAQRILTRQGSEAIDERIDVFALGAIFYRLLTGQRPYVFEDQIDGLRLASECKFDASLLEGSPKELKAICLKALAKEPSERWRSAADLANALRASAVPISQTPRLPILLAAIGVGLLLCFTIWFARDRKDQPLPEMVTHSSNPSTSPSQANGKTEPDTREPRSARVLPGATFTHIASEGNAEYVGPLFENGPVREGDALQIKLEFEQPGFCFLFAINPDGAVQLCYPHPDPETYEESLDETQSSMITELRYPASETQGFAFGDGAGQQIFIVVWSNRPLPSFRNWSASAGRLADAVQSTGRWIFLDGSVQPWQKRKQLRAAPRDLRGVKPFERVMKAIQADNPDCGVSGLSFPVEPK